MNRMIASAAALLILLPPVAASLERPKSTERAGVVPPVLAKGLPLDTTDVPPPPEAQLTAETEVFLDGRRCHFKNVPATASIKRMVLAEDSKTITRVEFQTKK